MFVRMGSTHDGTEERLGDRIRQARTRLGMSCNTLDERASLGGGTTSRMERGIRGHGERGTASEVIKRIAAALEVRPAWLFTGDGPMEAPKAKKVAS